MQLSLSLPSLLGTLLVLARAAWVRAALVTLFAPPACLIVPPSAGLL